MNAVLQKLNLPIKDNFENSKFSVRYISTNLRLTTVQTRLSASWKTLLSSIFHFILLSFCYVTPLMAQTSKNESLSMALVKALIHQQKARVLAPNWLACLLVKLREYWKKKMRMVC